MSKNIIIFDNEEFGKIRTVVIDNELWFVATDICKYFSVANSRNAVSRLDDDEKGVCDVDTNGGTQGLSVINEQGLYHLLFTLTPANARNVDKKEIEKRKEKVGKFRRWVTHEVLPTIRKTGGYINNSDLMVNTYFSYLPDDGKTLVKGLLTNIEELQKENTCLQNEKDYFEGKTLCLDKENDLLAQKNLQWADRPLICALVRAYATSIGNFGKAWNDFKKEILYKHGINLNSRITNYLNSTGKKTKPKTLSMLDDSELPKAISVAVSMCRENNVDIDYLLKKAS